MSQSTAESQPIGAGLSKARSRTTAHNVAGWVVDHFALISLIVLLIGVAVPATPPTAHQLIGATEGGFWSSRFGGANVMELLLLVLAAIWAVRTLLIRDRPLFFDRWLALGVAACLATQAVAFAFGSSYPEFIPLDVERLLILAAAYLVVTRAIHSGTALSRFTVAVAVVIVVRAVQLVLFYGITNKTGFGTITGRDALLITEDSLLLLFPVVLAWAALLEGRLTLVGMVGTLLLITFTLTVNFLSLRRGALIMIMLALIARTIPIGWKKMLAGSAVALTAFLLLVAAGPARPIVPDLAYATKSALLLTKDSSSSQRTAEIRNYLENSDLASIIVGKGIGTGWIAKVSSPVDAVAFGSGESEFRRIGWHVYGLDWLYKFGIVGMLIVVVTCSKLLIYIRRSMRCACGRMRSLIFSYAICTLPFLLFTFTNLRISLMAGICMGLLAVSVQLAAENQANSSPTRSTRD